MRIPNVLLCFLACNGVGSALHAQGGAPALVADATAVPKQTARKLPPCPPGVTHLSWGEFFKTPVGPMGFELTDRVKALDGKKVRLLGYMVRREEMHPGSLLLAPSPITIEEHEAGFSDLPPQTVRVNIPYAAKETVAYSTRPLLLVGTLTIGRQETSAEAVEGEVAWFNLVLEKPKPVVAMPGKAKTPPRAKPTVRTKQP